MFKVRSVLSLKKFIITVCITLILVLALSPRPQAARAVLTAVLDQVQDNNGGAADYGYSFSSFDPQPMWQEFKPTFDNVNAVDIHFGKVGSPGGSVTIEIKDAAGTSSLGSKTYNEADVPDGWKQVIFDTAIDLTPGSVYRIYYAISGGVYDLYNRLSWWGNNSGTSTYSCSPVDCQHVFYGSNPDFDFRFRTYGAPDATTTTINSHTPNPSRIGQSYTVDVTVTSSHTPQGTVDVDDGNGNTCLITLSGGTGACDLTSTTSGVKTLTAQYNSTAAFYDSVDTTTHDVTTQIFADGFESGDLSAWSSAWGTAAAANFNALACKLCVVSKGALVDSYSLKVRIPDNKPHYVQDDNPLSETEYHARFKFKRGRILKMTGGSKFKLLEAKNGTTTSFFIQVRKKGTKFQIRAVAKLDNGLNAATPWTILPKAATWIEVEWIASSGANDGMILLYINDILKGEQIDLDNDTFAVDLVRLGVAAKFRAKFTITGAFKLDAFDSDMAAHIGP